MVDDDPIDDMQGVAMTAGTALSRVAETVLRHVQERSRLTQAALERATEDARARESAQREVAERYFVRAQRPEFLERAEPRAIAQTWHAAQEWKDREPERFAAAADGLNEQFRARYGVDLSDAVEQGASRELVADAAETSVVKVREAEQLEKREREEALEAQRLIRDAEAKEAMARLTTEGPERDRLLSEANVHRRESAKTKDAASTRRMDGEGWTRRDLDGEGVMHQFLVSDEQGRPEKWAAYYDVDEKQFVARWADRTAYGADHAEGARTPDELQERVHGRIPAEVLEDLKHDPRASDMGRAQVPYDSPERRAATEREMAAAGVPEQARKARMTADQMNAHNPREAASATATKKKAAVRTVAAGRTRDTGRSR